MAGDDGAVGFAAGYVVLRLLLLALYGRARHHVHGQGRRLADIYLAGYSFTMGLWLLSIFIPGPYRYVLWGVAMLIDLAIPIRGWAVLKGRAVVVSHLTERFGTFFIIVLGESVLAVVAGVAGLEFTVESWIVAGLCFVVVLCTWWIYFDLADTSVVGRGALGLVYRLLPLPVAGRRGGVWRGHEARDRARGAAGLGRRHALGARGRNRRIRFVAGDPPRRGRMDITARPDVHRPDRTGCARDRVGRGRRRDCAGRVRRTPDRRRVRPADARGVDAPRGSGDRLRADRATPRIGRLESLTHFKSRHPVTDLQFRSAGAEDAGAIAALHADSWRLHYRGAYSDAFLDGDIRGDRLVVWVERLREPDRLSETIAAEGAEGLVGFAHTIFEADPRWGALLDNLHVIPGAKRRGIGSRLLALTAETVLARGTGLYLWVLEQNVDARAFYEARGGRCVERAPVPPPGASPPGSPAHPSGCVTRGLTPLSQLGLSEREHVGVRPGSGKVISNVRSATRPRCRIS